MENKTATVGIVCSYAANFFYLKTRFAAREDLKGYKLLWIGDERRAQQYAHVIDFAAIYVRSNEKRLNNFAKRAYNILQARKITVRLAWFQIINYDDAQNKFDNTD